MQSQMHYKRQEINVNILEKYLTDRFTIKQVKKIHIWLRTGIQLFFFLLFPSAYTAAFAGIKYIFTQIGAGEMVSVSSFVTVLIVLCGYTIIFGRFFCGFACAFGTLGDAVHAGYVWCCKKLKKKTGCSQPDDKYSLICMQIFDITHDCVDVLCRNLFQSTGNKPVGCIFHDPCR